MITKAFKELSFKLVFYKLCCLIFNSILIFFYIDDIVLVYRKAEES